MNAPEFLCAFKVNSSTLGITAGHCPYAQNKNTFTTLIKLPNWRKNNHICRVMGSVWVLFLLFARTYFAANLYTACMKDTITSI